MKKREANNLRKNSKLGIYFTLIILLIIIALRAFFDSLFITRPDRINIVFYGQKAAVYSLGKSDNINYFTHLYPDLKVHVPGGYGNYRIGALGKLISLEKKPELLRTIFSSVTSSFINFYFTSKSDEIFYGQEADNGVFLPSFSQIWLNTSNANIFDRLYLWLNFAFSKKSDFENIDRYPVIQEQQQVILDESNLAKRYQGFFYGRTYRQEKQNVQIFYTDDYESALTVSRILEGSGIRVVDISQLDKKLDKCILTAEESGSKTLKDMLRFFACEFDQDKTRVSDIIFELGNQEKVWSRE